MTFLFIYFVLMRFGFLPYLVGRFVADVLWVAPLTFDTSAWYADIGYTALAVALAVAVYGFWTSRIGAPAAAFPAGEHAA